MRKWALLGSLWGAFALTGCYIEAEDWDDGWDDWDEDDSGSGSSSSGPSLGERARDACEPYCLKLIQCEAIGDGALKGCIDLCVDRFKEDEDAVSDGCACVVDASCGSSSISSCEGDPIPGVWEGGDGDLDPGAGGAPGDGDGDGDGDGTGGTGDGDGDGTGGTGDGDGDGDGTGGGKSCTTNHECPLASDCIEGTCMARCAASCQCLEGEACVEGYCQPPEEPAASCETDCDCTSGEHCVDGFCE